MVFFREIEVSMFINHKPEPGSQTPFSPQTWTGTPGTYKTNVFILNRKHYLGLSGHREEQPVAWVLSYPYIFNKHHAQTRLGASSLQNVKEGSIITHNKWAYANSGVCAMHKLVFGV